MENNQKAARKSPVRSASIRRREEEEKFKAEEARRRAAFLERQAKLAREEADDLAEWLRAISWSYVDPPALDKILESEKIRARTADGREEEITLKEQLRRVFSKYRESVE